MADPPEESPRREHGDSGADKPEGGVSAPPRGPSIPAEVDILGDGAAMLPSTIPLNEWSKTQKEAEKFKREFLQVFARISREVFVALETPETETLRIEHATAVAQVLEARRVARAEAEAMLPDVGARAERMVDLDNFYGSMRSGVDDRYLDALVALGRPQTVFEYRRLKTGRAEWTLNPYIEAVKIVALKAIESALKAQGPPRIGWRFEVEVALSDGWTAWVTQVKMQTEEGEV